MFFPKTRRPLPALSGPKEFENKCAFILLVVNLSKRVSPEFSQKEISIKFSRFA